MTRSFQQRLRRPLVLLRKEVRRRVLDQWARYQLARRGLLRLLANRPPQAFGPDFSDMWFLYRAVRKQKPRCVLEFGSGCSTVMLAQALYENGSGQMYSIDADPHWASVTDACLPTHLRSICRVMHCPVKVLGHSNEGCPIIIHLDRPEVTPDFIYVDGPAHIDGSVNVIGIDVLELEDRLPRNTCVVVDGRPKNTAYLRQHLQRRHQLRFRWPFGNCVFHLVG